MRLKPTHHSKKVNPHLPKVIYYFEREGKTVKFYDQFIEVVAEKELTNMEATAFMVKFNAEASKHQYYGCHLDECAKERLYIRFHPVCRHAVKNVLGGMRMSYDYDDASAAAALGFMEALHRYDPTKGVQFQTYLTPHVKSESHTVRREQTPGVQPPKRAYDARGKAGRGEELTENEKVLVAHFPQFVDDYEQGENPGKGQQPKGERVKGFNRAEMLRAVDPNRLLDSNHQQDQLSFKVRQRLRELLSDDEYTLIADAFKIGSSLTRTTMKAKAEKLGVTQRTLHRRKKALLEKLAWDPILEDLNHQMNERLGVRDDVTADLTTKHNRALPGAE